MCVGGLPTAAFADSMRSMLLQAGTTDVSSLATTLSAG
jgi:hypothetical protein